MDEEPEQVLYYNAILHYSVLYQYLFVITADTLNGAARCNK